MLLKRDEGKHHEAEAAGFGMAATTNPEEKNHIEADGKRKVLSRPKAGMAKLCYDEADVMTRIKMYRRSDFRFHLRLFWV